MTLRLIDVITLKAAGLAILKAAKQDKISGKNTKRLKEAIKRADKLIKEAKEK